MPRIDSKTLGRGELGNHMCGICGIASQNSSISQNLLKQMAEQIIHRGPDSDGYFMNSAHTVGFGFRRLSIIDLSTGDQPIYNEKGSVAVIFNGEIYNFKEIRATLKSKGHVFKTNTDTEVIVHAYEEYGVECLQQFRGMFAFALWDDEAKTLFIGRDRVGKKPLFYFNNGQQFVFGSELKALLPTDIPKEISAEGLWLYLKYHYIPAPWSILQNVHKLPPAHYLLFDTKKNELVINRYWEPIYEPKNEISVEDASTQLLEHLKDAVRLRMISDVPLGVLLSGGIDSSLVTALMAENSNSAVKTFTIGFQEERFDERNLARKVAERYETEHHELVVTPKAMDVLPDLVWGLDEPMADSSVLPTYYVAKMAREHVTVVLNGDGGDEIFGGYNHLASLLQMAAFARLPPSLRNNWAIPLSNILDQTFKLSVTRRISNLATQSNWTPGDRYQSKMVMFLEPMHLMLQPPSRIEALDFLIDDYDDTLSDIDAILRADLSHVLPGDLLVKMDRMSMIHSLEARSPLLDHCVIEFANKLPSSLKVNRNQRKYILREVAKQYLPAEHFKHKKTGFSIPLKRWIEEGKLPTDTLKTEHAAIFSYLDFTSVQKLLFRHPGNHRRYDQIWALLILELWLTHVLKIQ